MSGEDWGYVDRKDVAERVIPIPPQATPRNELPRAVDNTVKNPGSAASAFFQLQYAKQCDDTRLLAAANMDANTEGGGGTKTSSTQAWYTRISRWCRVESIAHTTGGLGYHEDRIGLDYSLWALISSAAPDAPFVLRCEDVCACDLIDNTGTETCTGGMQFGLRQNSTGPATVVPDSPFIGFYCSIPDTVGGGTHYGNWHYLVCGDSGAGGVSGATGFTSEAPHRLMFEINLRDGTVTFYVDGTQVGQVSSYAGTITHTTDDGGLSWVTMAGGTGTHNGTMKTGYWMDLQANVSVRVLDEAA